MLCMHLSWKTRKIVVSKSKGRILPARACLLITEGRAREGKDPCLSTSTLLAHEQAIRAQCFGSYLNAHVTSAHVTSAKLSLRHPFTTAV